MWIDIDTIADIRAWGAKAPLGILSVDVDGNDFWFLKALIDLQPAMIIAEYNSSFGLAPVTVPYDREFDRETKHESRLYFGASLTAIDALASQHGYALVDVTQSGINAFFVRKDLLAPGDEAIPARYAFREKLFPGGVRAADLWKRIEHLPYINVATNPAALDPSVRTL